MTACCDAPESHPDGCACVRQREEPVEEPVEWVTLTLGALGGMHMPPADDVATVRRYLAEPVPPISATLRILSPADVAPEHCPLCIEAAKLDGRLRGERCPVHEADAAVHEESDDELRARLEVSPGGE